MGFDIRGKAALVTGANRGIGKAVVEALLERGASRVWAGVRRADALADLKASYGERLRLLQLDVTREDDVAAAAREATDVACWSTTPASRCSWGRLPRTRSGCARAAGRST